MMASFNKTILLGNLTRDPQLSYLPSQMAVCEFGLAVNRRWTGKDGQKKEEVCFIDCRLFDKQAETFDQYMSKGKSVLVEGRLTQNTWEKDGQKRSKHLVTVERFQFMSEPDKGSEPQTRSAHRVPVQQKPPDPPHTPEIPF